MSKVWVVENCRTVNLDNYNEETVWEIAHVASSEEAAKVYVQKQAPLERFHLYITGWEVDCE